MKLVNTPSAPPRVPGCVDYLQVFHLRLRMPGLRRQSNGLNAPERKVVLQSCKPYLRGIPPLSSFLQHYRLSAHTVSGIADRSASNSSRNVSAISGMEKDAMAARSGGERVSDAIARHAGRTWFIAAHAACFGGWILLNTGMLPGIRAFDPIPYQSLTFVVSLEAIFLSLFILMSQNRAN
jgi:Protein of unknown function (DUF1003)